MLNVSYMLSLLENKPKIVIHPSDGMSDEELLRRINILRTELADALPLNGGAANDMIEGTLATSLLSVANALAEERSSERITRDEDIVIVRKDIQEGAISELAEFIKSEPLAGLQLANGWNDRAIGYVLKRAREDPSMPIDTFISDLSRELRINSFLAIDLIAKWKHLLR